MQIYPLTLGLAQAYLVAAAGGMILIDTGSPGQEHKVLRQMQRLGRTDLRLIFITHAHLDHFGSTAALHRITGAPIAIHALDSKALAEGSTTLGTVRCWRGKAVQWLFPIIHNLLQPQAVQPDILVKDFDNLSSVGVSCQVLHTPGHTPGSSCLLVEGKYAFVGDLISTTGHPHVQRYYASDWSLIPISLARLKTAQPGWTCPGHGRKPISLSILQEMNCDGITN